MLLTILGIIDTVARAVLAICICILGIYGMTEGKASLYRVPRDH